MKSLASDPPSQYAIDLQPSSLWNGSKQKKNRCKSVDAFIFLMGSMDNERYADGSSRKVTSSDVILRDREAWQSDFYKDDYDTSE